MRTFLVSIILSIISLPPCLVSPICFQFFLLVRNTHFFPSINILNDDCNLGNICSNCLLIAVCTHIRFGNWQCDIHLVFLILETFAFPVTVTVWLDFAVSLMNSVQVRHFSPLTNVSYLTHKPPIIK